MIFRLKKDQNKMIELTEENAVPIEEEHGTTTIAQESGTLPLENSDPRKQKNQNKYKNRITEWCLSTSIHGIGPFVRNSDSLLLKIIWIVSSLASASLCFYLLTESTTDHLRYEVDTKIKVINDEEAFFPLITFCNLNRFNTSDRSVYKELNDYIKFKYNDSLKEIHPAFAFKVLQKALNSYVFSKNDSEKQRLGQNFYAMIYDCIFSSEPCGKHDGLNMTWFYDYDYGSCYKFNANESKPLRSDKEGHEGGLYLALYIGNSSKEEFVDKRGLRVLITNYLDKVIDIKGKGFDFLFVFLIIFDFYFII